MDSTIYLIIAIAIFILLVGFLVFRVMRKKKNPDAEPVEMDYRALFVLGLCFLPAGIAISLSSGEFAYNGLSALGLIYLIVGAANREKWKS